ncbi:MAG: cytochrome c biogenesis protein ResB [Alphaproteobacteria bacterium]|nr:cytochrome c biogenesis protein ResB [Alphaproteobacteria bacterium]
MQIGMPLNAKTSTPFTPALRRLLNWLAHPHILFWSLPYVMVVLTIGTLAQKNLGLYTAQKIYFSEPILWLGFMPAPGMPVVLGLITLSLATKFFLSSLWYWHKAGINLTHLGVLLLMVGGLLTFLTQREGFLLIPEQGKTSIIRDYHHRVFTVRHEDKILWQKNFLALRAGDSFDLPENMGRITVDKTCLNCMPAMAEKPDGRRGMAEKVTLNAIAPEKENEQNIAGAEITITGQHTDINGTYVLMERMAEHISFSDKDENMSLHLGRFETYLPFEVELNHFAREFHPGTSEPRAYRSHVTIIESGQKWPYVIEMNEPLRYKGYTLYQSSFVEDPKGVQTVLSVVENKGRLFPYIASLLIFIGLLVHVLIRLRHKSETSS